MNYILSSNDKKSKLFKDIFINCFFLPLLLPFFSIVSSEKVENQQENPPHQCEYHEEKQESAHAGHHVFHLHVAGSVEPLTDFNGECQHDHYRERIDKCNHQRMILQQLEDEIRC